ncbi:MAG TPA: prolipoprotein diacylglyceryl transferase [Gemmatimonadales bacterium]|jgi:phosphatidylglycerol:prolipoprotein diacylglycerol transferase
MITAHPLVFHLGPLPITGFGIMMALAFAVGGWLIDRECHRLGFRAEYAGDMIFGALVGGIVGAKLWFVALHGADALFDRGGLVWYGGFLGGTLGVILSGWRRRVPMAWTAQLVAPALPAAYAIGRVGCYLVGDDYGVPTNLPWAVRFPEGMPPTTADNLRAFHVHVAANIPGNTVLAVHPTQLYEVFFMIVVFACIWRWRTLPRGTGWLFGAYLTLAGIERFIVEFWRAKDDRNLAGILSALSIAQVTSIVVVIAGVVTMVVLAKKPQLSTGPWLTDPPGGLEGGLAGQG